MSDRPQLLIAGAGYAGLAAYLAVRRQVQAGVVGVTVVNGDDWHLLLPELPLYLSGEEDAGDLRLDLHRAVTPPARLVIAQISGLDVRRPAVQCAGEPGRLEGDGLLVALGSISSDFGVPGVAQHALAIGSWADAEHLRERLLVDMESKHPSSVAVVGAGFTGVEIAAALAERAQEAGAGLRVTLVGEEVLPPMPPEVRRIALEALRRLGVRLMADRASRVDEGQVGLEHGPPLRADTIVWAAGVRANPLLGQCGLETNKRGQAAVDGHLRAAPRVYCAGDCAAITDPETGRPAAATAQLALQEGPGAMLNLLREWQGRPLLQVVPRQRGFLVCLGRSQAAGTVFGARVHGSEVAVLKRLIERYHAFQVGGLHALARGLLRGAGSAPAGESTPAAGEAHASRA